jgi:poly-beta-hydroxyalkanoate depolymerase
MGWRAPALDATQRNLGTIRARISTDTLAPHRDLVLHLVRGDRESAERHREFYDEYLSVMGLIFIKHALAKGEMRHWGWRVRPHRIRLVALHRGRRIGRHHGAWTERGTSFVLRHPQRSQSALRAKRAWTLGVFNGRRFREEIVPRIARFLRSNEKRSHLTAGPAKSLHGYIASSSVTSVQRRQEVPLRLKPSQDDG